MNLPRRLPVPRERKLGFEWAAPFRLDRIHEVLAGSGRLAGRLTAPPGRSSLPAGRADRPAAGGLVPRNRRTAWASRLLRAGTATFAGLGAAALFEIWNSIELPTAVLRAALGSQKAARRDLAR